MDPHEPPSAPRNGRPSGPIVRHWRKANALALLVVVLLAGCATTQPYATTPATSQAGTTPTCPAEGVQLRTDDVDAAMGLRALGITLINCGHAPYQVDDYPRVRALDEDHSPLNVTVLEGVGDIAPGIPIAGATPQPLVLQPGERAGAAVVWRNKYDDIREPPVDVVYLRMAPQLGRPAQLLEPEGGLDLGSTGRLAVSPWVPLPENGPSPSWTPPNSAAPEVSAPPPTEEPPLL
ncbi:DUF4232 domain-containing protein [Actinoplanes sp. Pm04-4]|uniref:DUF4232 domain-containing protein n=1 Tax=Paractinoplanes pyxinae TaxID=2997416 RepID=A0ABT4B2Z6_9ACTN|nr:DUF4232 domain-containing protein [Actinoplanes pyxinae]MCY1140876.1 DUF4232 domain-containing protein [Actinoplanes pyxinae]